MTDQNKTRQQEYADLGQYLTWLTDGKDASRAPELARWLLDGPLTLDELIERRYDMQLAKANPTVAGAYAPASVFFDLGRVAHLGGAVEYVDGKFQLNESYRRAVEVYDQIARLAEAECRTFHRPRAEW